MRVKCAGLLLSVALALGCGTSGTPVASTSGQARGSLDRKVIKEVIRDHHREVRACYEMELTRQPDLAGRVLSQFTISASGDVVQVVLRDSTLGNPSIEECVRHRLLSWKFPRPEGGAVEASYAFNFFPSP
jgi:outer membrane biosynthesis protein TonB